MFCAKLIPNNDYYHARRISYLMWFLTSAAIGVLVNFDRMPLWLTIPAAAVLLVAFGVQGRVGKKMRTLSYGTIQIDEAGIRIVSQEGEVIKSFDRNKLEAISSADSISIAGETSSQLINEILGKTQKNYLIIKDDTGTFRYDFEINTHYMISRLNHYLSRLKSVAPALQMA